MGRRIRGENVAVALVSNGVSVLLSERAVVSLEYTPQQEITSTGLLGETTERKDEVYKGCGGTLTLQASDGSVRDFIRKLNDRARRAVPDFKVNLTAIDEYPDGDTRKVLFPDAKFGGMSTNISSRDAYVSFSLPWAVDDYRVLQ